MIPGDSEHVEADKIDYRLKKHGDSSPLLVAEFNQGKEKTTMNNHSLHFSLSIPLLFFQQADHRKAIWS